MLEECQTYRIQKMSWPRPAPFEGKLYGDVINLRLTVIFFIYANNKTAEENSEDGLCADSG